MRGLAELIEHGGAEVVVPLVFFDEGLQGGGQLLQLLAAVHQHLAAQQVQALDAVGALVDLADAGVTDVLLHAPLADIAVAAEDLLALHGDVEAVVGHERLGDRRQQGHQIGGFLAGGLVGVVVLGVDAEGQPHRHRAARLGVGLAGQQHAAHVGVHDDGVGALGRVDARVRGASGVRSLA